MNRLIIPNGGMPLEGDDFIFMQDAFKEALHGLVANYSDAEDGYLILSGCDYNFNGTDYDISEGFVLLNKEVCYHAGSSGITSLSNASFRIQLTYDSSGNDVFQDGQSKDTYEIRRVVVGNALIGAQELVLLTAKRLTNLAANSAFENIQPSVISVSFGSGWLSSNVNSLIVRKRGKLVQFEGGVTGGNTNTDVVLLPEGFRPAKIQKFVAVLGNNDLVGITVRPDGWLAFLTTDQVSVAEPNYVGLSSVSFWLE